VGIAIDKFEGYHEKEREVRDGLKIEGRPAK
jgi:hypothetical protein